MEMMPIVLLISYILIFTFLMITLIKCLKNKSTWKKLFLCEIFSIIVSIILMRYYDSLPGYGMMPGLTYLGEILVSFGAAVLFGLLLAVTILLKFIIYLIEKKKQGKNYFPKIIFTLSILVFAFGIYNFVVDFRNDIHIGKTNATILYYTENEFGYERPVVKYVIDGKTYEVMVRVLTDEIQNSTINDEVKIYYDKANPSQLAHLTHYENIYIPCFIVSFLLFLTARKSKKNIQ